MIHRSREGHMPDRLYLESRGRIRRIRAKEENSSMAKSVNLDARRKKRIFWDERGKEGRGRERKDNSDKRATGRDASSMRLRLR